MELIPFPTNGLFEVTMSDRYYRGRPWYFTTDPSSQLLELVKAGSGFDTGLAEQVLFPDDLTL